MSDSETLWLLTIAKQRVMPHWQGWKMASFSRRQKRPSLKFSLPSISIEYQQNLTDRKIAIIILRARSNRLKDLLLLVPACLAHIETIQPGKIVRIDG